MGMIKRVTAGRKGRSTAKVARARTKPARANSVKAKGTKGRSGLLSRAKSAVGRVRGAKPRAAARARTSAYKSAAKRSR